MGKTNTERKVFYKGKNLPDSTNKLKNSLLLRWYHSESEMQQWQTQVILAFPLSMKTSLILSVRLNLRKIQLK